ncbi:MAG: hypothetical protein U5K38_05790 [Woeseiaceae bacterium]|nr:hypothetical protein [Woeseiaceae bacterium]
MVKETHKDQEGRNRDHDHCPHLVDLVAADGYADFPALETDPQQPAAAPIDNVRLISTPTLVHWKLKPPLSG